MRPSTQELSNRNSGLAWGLDLQNPDVTTPEEIDAFRAMSREQLGMQQDGLDYWLDSRPDVLKRYRLWAQQRHIVEAHEAPNTWTASGIAIMYHYAMTGFEEGLRYSLVGSNKTMCKDQLLEQMALVFRYAGPRGMYTLARAAKQHDWVEPAEPARWPTGWAPDPEAFRSGADFTNPGVTPQDTVCILGWYERVLGEIPRHVTLLAEYHPRLLKAYRNRYEHSLRILPKQAEPWALLQISIQRGFAGGIREAMLLGRAWGLTKTQIIEAISGSVFYGGHESLNLVDEAAGDILATWTR